ncbi:antibiotic biosynthesis monooxygenase [Pelomonas sp. Root1444]|uniref:antibiotic biosynthesis monooxygenase n=1 Tax=Pelomonas sp. Root1444 TaxID=1736464 RepID=UPI00070278A5|nr:antibiotic biosynthesis monooxygenase [Pelomonas sp. Root1444]KQY88230.1 antibiotic biosynthesis monooxygenase [Pelomonas sp. Root1444]
MDHVLIVHAVKDFPIWKQVLDEAAGIRKEAGEQSYHLLHDEFDRSRVAHFSRWTSLAQAKAFFEADRLVEIRRLAGVDAPEFNYLHNMEQGTL